MFSQNLLRSAKVCSSHCNREMFSNNSWTTPGTDPSLLRQKVWMINLRTHLWISIALGIKKYPRATRQCECWPLPTSSASFCSISLPVLRAPTIPAFFPAFSNTEPSKCSFLCPNAHLPCTHKQHCLVNSYSSL